MASSGILKGFAAWTGSLEIVSPYI